MSDPTDPVSLGSGAVSSMKSFIGRGAKVSAPITTFCGIIADLASTIGAFSLYLLIAAICMTIISGFMWFSRYKREYLQAAADGVLQPSEIAALGERNAWSVTFAFSVIATIVMGGFVLAASLAGKEDKGVLASVVPGMDKVQDALFRLEAKVDDIKDDTTAIRKDTADVKTDTARIAASVEEIAKRFDSLGGTGALIANPKTPEEHYHNARIHELGGKFGEARKSYAAYLAADLETIDPWLNYSGMLKIQEGKEGAVENMRYFADKAKSVSYQVAMALLLDRDPRLAKLQDLAKAFPGYGPLPYLIAQEYSETKRGDTTLAEKRSEKEWLEKFKAAHANGKFVRYFIDKKEAQKWIETAESRLARIDSTPTKVLENPVNITLSQSNSGWGMTFSLTDFKVKELLYRMDGKGDFVSTGHQNFINPQTGLPMITMYVNLPGLTPGEHTVEVKYTDKNDVTNGPYTLKFSTEAEKFKMGKATLDLTSDSWLLFQNHDGKLLLYFTSVLGYRPILKEIRYSLNNDTLDQTFDFEPADTGFEVGTKIHTAVPKDTTFACIQLHYKDGTKSAVKRFERK